MSCEALSKNDRELRVRAHPRQTYLQQALSAMSYAAQELGQSHHIARHLCSEAERIFCVSNGGLVVQRFEVPISGILTATMTDLLQLEGA